MLDTAVFAAVAAPLGPPVSLRSPEDDESGGVSEKTAPGTPQTRLGSPP
jgi:hypothetical protein